MKVLFVQLRFESNFAIMALSSVLKSRGHSAEVMIIEGEEDYAAKAVSIAPEVIAFSSTTVDIGMMTGINRRLKTALKFFSVFGGSHATFFPEFLENEPDIDAVCVGEGEGFLLELLDLLQSGKDYAGIDNLCLLKSKKLLRNKLRPLILDLDTLPPFDRHIYDRYYNNAYLRENVPIRFLSSRGCPYNCTYCFNHRFFELYGNTASRIRKRSVNNLISEIEQAKRDFDIPMVSFADDIFPLPLEWMREFAVEYKRRVGLPYTVNTRPNAVNEEVVSLLSGSGCYYAAFSIESGDEDLRNRILKRNISDTEILNAASLFHKYGIHFTTGNMLAVPGEDMMTLKRSVEINRKCSPHYAWASLFQPFPGFELTRYAVENGYFDSQFDAIGQDQFTDSPLKLKDKKRIVRFHKFFALAVRYPWLSPVIGLLCSLPFDKAYERFFRWYKARLNLAVIRVKKEDIQRHCREPFVKVLAEYVLGGAKT